MNSTILQIGFQQQFQSIGEFGHQAEVNFLSSNGVSEPFEFERVPVDSLFRPNASDSITQQINGRKVVLVDYSAGFLPIAVLHRIPWLDLDCGLVLLETAGMPSREVRAAKRLLKRCKLFAVNGGLRFSGTEILFERAHGNHQWLRLRVRGMRAATGRVVVSARKYLWNQDLRKALGRRLSRFVNPWAPRKTILDRAFGIPLRPLNILESYAEVAKFQNKQIDFKVQEVSVHTSGDAEKIARRCFKKLGVWPISFSFPAFVEDRQRFPRNALSSVIPGEKYSYSNPLEYIQQYTESRLAITHRKAGWDCFRHVEILASGSVPWMLDATAIPEFSMVHYPKTAMIEIANAARTLGAVPDSETRITFNEYFQKNLTTKAMAEYMLSVSGLSSSVRVLFVDAALPAMADYQSVLALIGLKQIYGSDCEVLSPVDYVYEDWTGDESVLYGRGFGYSRSLASDLRSEWELNSQNTVDNASADLEGLERFDAIVVGSISRNAEIAQHLTNLFPPKKTIWIHGEDSPPAWREVRAYQKTQAHVFVRSINA